jgi:tetratricopeptide (TPR) repeat protein
MGNVVAEIKKHTIEVKMNAKIVPILRALEMCLCVGLVSLSFSVARAQDKPADQPKVSEGEQQALNKLNAAAGIDAKLKAAQEYIKKNSKSQMRPKVASHVADQISAVDDPGKRLSAINEFNKIFNQPTEAELVKPIEIEALSRQGKFDDVMSEGGKYLEKNPDDVVVNTIVAFAGANVAQKTPTNTAAIQKATQASAKAVESMEMDKKPEKMEAANWTNFRNAWLPRLYQARGMLLGLGGDKAGAKEQLDKSLGIDPYDVNTLLMLSNFQSEEYQALAEKYKTDKQSATADKAVAIMDEMIIVLARAAAVMEGDSKLQAMHAQVMEQLKSYYSFRHNNSTDGLKELVDKYKKK